MKTITLRNEFHNTEVVVEVQNGGISDKALDYAGKVLCGMSDCACGSVPMSGYCVVDTHGDEYNVLAD